MNEQEKVIKALECCISGNPAICKRRGCPYADEHEGVGDTCIDHVMADAIALLKAQEPVEPVRRRRHGQIGYSCFCGMCGYGIGRNEKYCALCGRPVKWG